MVNIVAKSSGNADRIALRELAELLEEALGERACGGRGCE
jgi:hypothetical protein